MPTIKQSIELISSQKKWKESLLVFLIVFYPLSELFIYWNKLFTSDWHNSIWLIGYQKYYWLAHHAFTPVLNTPEMVGLTIPTFYGSLFYPLMGILSIPTNPHVTLRLVIFLVWFLQFLLVRKAAITVGADKTQATLVGTFLCWAIYPLTNIYTRSACIEFFGTAFILCALCCWLIILNSKELKTRWKYASFYCLFLTLLFGTHPISAFYGGILLGFVFLLGTIHRFNTHRDRIPFEGVTFVISGLIALVAVSPWLYALSQFGSKLEISQTLSRVGYYPGIDEWWVRLFPLPIDYRALFGGTSIPTPYLDAQLSLPLLIFCLAEIRWGYKILGRDRFLGNPMGKVTLFLATTFMFLFVLSVNHKMAEFFPAFFGKIQIAYRWVSYQNLLLFLMTLAIFRLNASGSELRLEAVPKRVPPIVLHTFLLTMAGLAVLLRLLHAYPITHEGRKFGYTTFSNLAEYVHIPESYYSPIDYIVREGVQKIKLTPKDITGTTAVGVDGMPDFGLTQPRLIPIDVPGWKATNICPFPWNHLIVNGRRLPISELAIYDHRLAFRYPSTEALHIRYSFEPAPVYLWLRWLSFSILGSLLLFNIWIVLPDYFLSVPILKPLRSR